MPFSVSANPNWLYLTPSIRNTFDMIRQLIEDRQGLAFILGDVGMGKTTALKFLYSEVSSQEEDLCFDPHHPGQLPFPVCLPAQDLRGLRDRCEALAGRPAGGVRALPARPIQGRENGGGLY